MKKNKILLTMFGVVLTLSGCVSKSKEVEVEQVETNEVFEVLIEGNISSMEYIILREKKTDILYLYSEDNYSSTMTVMIEEDGSPLTYNEWLGGE